MHLRFLGATKEVTGTCYLLETAQRNILIDCGLFQGGRGDSQRNQQPFPFRPQELHAVFLTHAHMDHVGRVPQLVKRGYRGPIFATEPTVELAKLLWQDMLHIMAEWKRREDVEPLYDERDVAAAAERLEAVEYGKMLSLDHGTASAVFHDAGHILGSSFIRVEADGKSVTFSGDLGNDDVAILKPTARLPRTDVLLIESTYGDRLHEGPETRINALREAVKEAAARKGTLIIPAFAIERTQEIMLALHRMAEAGEIPRIPVFLDSPLAIDATRVYEDFARYFNPTARKESFTGHDLFSLPGYVATRSVELSKSINEVLPPKVVIAGSGMMTGGRVLHHLIRALPDPRSTIMIVGFQGKGTLGRKIEEGAPTVTIHKQVVPVAARVMKIDSWSAHADQAKLLRWVAEAEGAPGRVFVTHGEDRAAEVLAEKLRGTGLVAEVPSPGETVDLG